MPNSTTASEPVLAALVSVGGSPDPVIHILGVHRPTHVWYFCSEGSRGVADQIHRQLDWHPQSDFIEISKFEELGPCYRELRNAIPVLLGKWRIPPESVLVDYTGGTKTMSVALGLAATEVFSRFSYVGGDQREKGGLGVTIGGRERVVYQSNPWGELAVREIEECARLWEHGLFESVRAILSEVAPRTPRPLRFEAIATIAEGLAARSRLDFKSAVKTFGSVSKTLPQLFENSDDSGLIQFAGDCLKICTDCQSKEPNETLLREILFNSVQTAAQSRYEDAAARLYRAMEMQGQLWLSEKTEGRFKNGKLAKGVPLPDELRNLPFCEPSEDWEVKLSLEQVFKALHALNDERAAKIVGDIALESKSRFRSGTQMRNSSILAHGVSAITAENFDSMKRIASEFLGFDLDTPFQIYPTLEGSWFS